MMRNPIANWLLGESDVMSPTAGEGAVSPVIWTGCAAIFRAIARALIDDPLSQRHAQQAILRRGIVYQPHRRELAFRRLGLPQLFFPRQVFDEHYDQKNVHLYLDVSGSMTGDSILPFLYGLLIYLHGQISAPFYHFTTLVRPVTLEQIKQGVLVAGGTDIDCVITHALENRFSRILVISDGDFGEVEPNLLIDAGRHGLTAIFLLTTPTTLPASAASLGPSWPIHEELAELQHQRILAMRHDGPPGKGTGSNSRIVHNPVPWFTVTGC